MFVTSWTMFVGIPCDHATGQGGPSSCGKSRMLPSPLQLPNREREKKPKPKSARKKAKKATWVAAGNWGEIQSIWVQIALYRLVVLLSIWNCLQSWPNAGQQLHRVSVGLPTSVTRLVEVYILFSCLGNVIYMMLNCYTHSCHSLLNVST